MRLYFPVSLISLSIHLVIFPLLLCIVPLCHLPPSSHTSTLVILSWPFSNFYSLYLCHVSALYNTCVPMRESLQTPRQECIARSRVFTRTSRQPANDFAERVSKTGMKHRLCCNGVLGARSKTTCNAVDRCQYCVYDMFTASYPFSLSPSRFEGVDGYSL